MKRALAFVALLFVSACSHTAAKPLFAYVDHGISSRRLPSGLQLVVVRRATPGSVRVTVAYGIGSEHDPPGYRGLAHATEHMMFRGTKNVSGPAMYGTLADVGAVAHAATGPDQTVFSTRVATDALGAMLRLEADRMSNLRLRNADWQHEKRTVIEEIARDGDDAGTQLMARVRAAAYADTASAQTSPGSAEDVARIPIAEIRREYRDGYSPSRAVVIVAGDLPDGSLDRVARAFAAVPSRPFRMLHLAPVTPSAGSSVTVADERDAGTVVVAYRVPGVGAKGGAHSVALAAIVDMAGSPLRERVRSFGELTVGMTIRHRSGLLYLRVRPRAPVPAARIIEALRLGMADSLQAPVLERGLARLRAFEGLATVSIDESLIVLSNKLALEAGTNGYRLRSRYDDFSRMDAGSLLEFARRDMQAPAVVGSVVRGRVERTSLPAIAAHKAEAESWGSVAAAALPAIPDPLRDVRFGALSNGLRYAIRRDGLAPTVSLSIGIGAAAEPSACTAQHAALTSALAGGGERFSPAERRELLGGRGGSLTFDGDIRGHAAADDTALLIDTVADTLEHPRFLREPDAQTARCAAVLIGPTATTVAIAGTLDPVDVERRLIAAFGDWSAPYARSPLPRASDAPGITVEHRGATSFVSAGGAAPEMDDVGYAQAAVCVAIAQARLLRALRFEHGWTYSVDAGVSGAGQRGHWYVRADAQNSAAEAVRQAISAAFSDIALHPPDEREMARARAKLIADYVVSDGRSSSLWEMRLELDNERRPKLIARTIDRIRTVSAPDVRAFARSRAGAMRARVASR